MSRFLGDNTRRPASAGGSSKPFDASRTNQANSSTVQSSIPQSLPPASMSSSPALRRTAQTASSPRSLASTSGLASESSWSSLGSALSSAPSSALSTSPGASIVNQSISSKRPQTAAALAPILQFLPSSTAGSSSNRKEELQSASPRFTTPSMTSSLQSRQSEPVKPITPAATAGSSPVHTRRPGTGNSSSSFGAITGKNTSRQREKDLQTSLSLPDTLGGGRHSSESETTDHSRSLHGSRPSVERGSNSSLHNDSDHASLRHAEALFGLPYGQKNTNFTKSDRSSAAAGVSSSSGSGYQTGDPTSSDWSFFSRSNWSRPPDHPFPPSEVPYAQGYDNRLLDFRYIRYQAAKQLGCMLPWSDKEQFKGFKPKKALDIGCGPAASWIFEASEVWTTTHFVGLDIAPVLVPLSRLPEQVHSRVEFIQANFLQSWPFEDDSFDFVRIAFAGIAIPEHSWHHVFEETARVLSKVGWTQCIDESFIMTAPRLTMSNAALQGNGSKETHSRNLLEVGPSADLPFSAASPTSAAFKAEPSQNTDSHTPTQAKLTAFERALASMQYTFEKRMLSVYPRSIFPAAMVLSCTDIVSQGPMSVGLGLESPALDNLRVGTDDTATDIAATLFVDSLGCVMDGMAPMFSDVIRDDSSKCGDLRAEIELEKCWHATGVILRSKADISTVLSERMGWTCKTDEMIETALAQQVAAVEAEKKQLLASQSASEGPVDEYKVTEVDRALRDVKSDLAATRRRLGRTAPGEDDRFSQSALKDMQVGADFLMKAGRKAV